MGRINHIWRPKDWKIELRGINRRLDGDIVYKMIIGKGSDMEIYDITEFISEINYERIIQEIYEVKVFPYAEIPVLLINDKKEVISLVNGYNFPYDKLNTFQIGYLKENCTNFGQKSHKLIKKRKL